MTDSWSAYRLVCGLEVSISHLCPPGVTFYNQKWRLYHESKEGLRLYIQEKKSTIPDILAEDGNLDPVKVRTQSILETENHFLGMLPILFYHNKRLIRDKLSPAYILFLSWQWSVLDGSWNKLDFLRLLRKSLTNLELIKDDQVGSAKCRRMW